LDVYSSVLQWLKKDGSFQDKDIDEAKLRLFSSIDHPVAPSRQGTSPPVSHNTGVQPIMIDVIGFMCAGTLEFTSGITWEMRQKNREGILDATRKDLIEVAEKYLVPATEGNAGTFSSVAILGNAAHNPFTAEETLHLSMNGAIEEGEEFAEGDEDDEEEEEGEDEHQRR
jgi:Zn-dependent M16 (insulinase) family peptidase